MTLRISLAIIGSLVVALASCSASQRAGELSAVCAAAPAGLAALNVVVDTLVAVATGGTALDPGVTAAIDGIERALDDRANAACAARDAGATMAARPRASYRLTAAMLSHPAHVMVTP